MRHEFSAAIAVAILVGLPASASAGPLIRAANVAAKCSILPDGTATTVAVALDNATYNFYGPSLAYHFTPNTSGVVQHLPMPAGSSNPVTLAVSPGVYILQITNQMAPGGSSSVNYNVTVPAGMFTTFRGRKMCLARALKEQNRIAKEKMLAPE